MLKLGVLFKLAGLAVELIGFKGLNRLPLNRYYVLKF